MTGSRVATLLLSCACQSLVLGQAQPPALDVFLVVDNSGSMKAHDAGLSIARALSTFARRLPLNSQLGILLFDSDPKLVMRLASTANGQSQSAVDAGLRELNYRGLRSDLAGAVERAVYELREQGRSSARRAIVLVTDGVPDLGGRSATVAKTRWLREDLPLEARRFGISIFPVIVSDAADYELALALARPTGGEYYRALAPALLPPALAQVNERLAGMVDNVEDRPARPVNKGIPVRPDALGHYLMLGSLITLAVAVLVLLALLARRRPARPMTPGPEASENAVAEPPPIPSLSALREQGAAVSREMANATDLLTQAGSRISQFQAAVERYALSNYRALQEAEEQCFTLARECILLLDHLDIMIQRGEQKGEQLHSLRDTRRRLCSLLETAEIEEIPVNAGDVFDGAVHISTGVVGSSGREGVVVAVLRKGYAMKAGAKSDTVLRAAEVTVSAGQMEPEPGSGDRS